MGIIGKIKAFLGKKDSKVNQIKITEITKMQEKTPVYAKNTAGADSGSARRGPASDNESARRGPASDNESARRGSARDNESARRGPARDNESARRGPARDNESARRGPARDNVSSGAANNSGRSKKRPVVSGRDDVTSRSAKDDGAPLIENFTPEAWDASLHQPEGAEGKVPFSTMGLAPQILRGLHKVGFEYCTPIQEEILPHALKGKDVSGKAQTGTGKTAAFLLTILQRLMSQPSKPRRFSSPRALIMAPTRELALQIEKDAVALSEFCGARVMAVFGGVGYDKQLEALNNKYIDIVIATPGRVLDYYKRKAIYLDRVEILVLDEADRMLDMGFLPDIRRIINAVPPVSERQTMLFSATISPSIMRLASMWTDNPVEVNVEPEQVASANIEQRAYIVGKEDKLRLLYSILKQNNYGRVIIFANRRDQVKRLADKLKDYGFSCGMLTGDVTQNKRIKTLENLRNGKINILVATDVAGRGIHVDGVEVVFNYTLPEFPEDYVHRIGRTGRAEAKGLSISFATEEDSYMLPQIEEHLKSKLKYVYLEDDDFVDLPKISHDKRKSKK